MKKTLGGNRLGSGNKMTVELHNYERSTHDMGYLWRSTMAAGTLVPFMSEVALPGDTFDINLDCDIKTHPTIGPLFGSYKVQLDIFQAPVRLYQGQLHNNKLGIGLNMASVKLPQIKLIAYNKQIVNATDLDNCQINPSCLLSYLDLRGIGYVPDVDGSWPREFNAIPLLAYFDTYKNYYANKQEGIGAVIHSDVVALVQTIDDIVIDSVALNQAPGDTAIDPTNGILQIDYTGTTPILNQIMVNTTEGQFSLEQITSPLSTATGVIMRKILPQYMAITYISWDYIKAGQLPTISPKVQTFPLENLDKMRENILAATTTPAAYVIEAGADAPYGYLFQGNGERTSITQTQECLAIKTYQSDLFNNWLDTETIDGDGGINDITAIDTSGGSFTLDTLNLSKKVYNMLNRIAVSGGSYDDWMDAVYTHDRYTRAETPIYHGGLIKELVFQEVISNAQAETPDTPIQPLGTLAGKGTMAKKHKGGHVTIKVDEISYIMGIISLTPRLDYSQGNKWDVNLKTMDDFHKPALDEIGFQELITEQMAWWSTKLVGGTTWTTASAGKQPAWINYMTNVNKVRGNFAIDTNEMFMTLNRRYENNAGAIKDLTTYIDPVKFNHIFAQTSIDAQNFWVQIAVDITARRKMSAKIMPNL